MVPTSAWAVRGCSAVPAMGLRGFDGRSRHFSHLHVIALATVLRGGCGSRRESATTTAPRMAASGPRNIALDSFARRSDPKSKDSHTIKPLWDCLRNCFFCTLFHNQGSLEFSCVPWGRRCHLPAFLCVLTVPYARNSCMEYVVHSHS
jgi:hypothetical protein